MPGGSRHVPARPGRTAPRAPVRKEGKPPAGRGDTAADSGGAPGRREAPPAAAPDTGRIAAVAEPVVHALGMDLESVKVTTAGRRRLLRVVVDSDRGVSLDDAALASRELSAKLDASDVMGDMPYTLEVSSPGVDRPLTEPRHWQRAAGRLVRVPLTPSGHAKAGHGKPGASAVQGRVVAADASGVTLDIDGTRRQFGYAALGAGVVQIEFDRPEAAPHTGESAGGESTADTRGPQRREAGAEPHGH